MKNKKHDYIILDELFEYFPKRLEYKGTCAGYPIYSNETIEKTTLDWITKFQNTTEISRIIEKGMLSKNILIGFTNPSVWSFIRNKFRKNFVKKANMWFGWNLYGLFGQDSTLGLYSKEDKNLAVILDPSVNVFGKAVISIPAVITHELCHKAASDITKSFLNFQLEKTLLPYYSEVLRWIDTRFENIDEEKLKRHIINLTIMTEKKSGSNISRNAAILWFEFFKENGLNEDESLECVYKILLPFYTYVIEEKLRDCPKELVKRSNEFSEYFYRGYDAIGLHDSRNLTEVGQEGLFPSEVIAMANESDPDNNTISMLKKLDFR